MNLALIDILIFCLIVIMGFGRDVLVKTF